jgi:hypothetical protein
MLSDTAPPLRLDGCVLFVVKQTTHKYFAFLFLSLRRRMRTESDDDHDDRNRKGGEEREKRANEREGKREG